MARNGVWELRNVMLRYCATGGSSVGVREFVESGLAHFAEKNPQILFKTQIESGHPCVYGDYSMFLMFNSRTVFFAFSRTLHIFHNLSNCYFFIFLATTYKRQRTLKNLSRNEVREAVQELRDTLGRKVPKHNEISIGVLERPRLSVQGVPRNSATSEADLPQLRARRERLRKEYRMQDLVKQVGLTGMVEITQKIIEHRDEHRKALIEAMPKRTKVNPTE